MYSSGLFLCVLCRIIHLFDFTIRHLTIEKIIELIDFKR